MLEVINIIKKNFSSERRPLPQNFSDDLRQRTDLFIRDKVDGPTLLKTEIVQNLGLDYNNTGISPKKIDLLYDTITRVTISVSETLGIPPPMTEFDEDWINRNNSASVYSDDYKIKWNPKWLVETLSHDSLYIKMHVGFTTGHEIRHRWQQIHDPNCLQERADKLKVFMENHPDLDKKTIKGLTTMEIDAMKFGIDTVFGIDTKGLREMSRKAKIMINMSTELVKQMSLRAKLGIDF